MINPFLKKYLLFLLNLCWRFLDKMLYKLRSIDSAFSKKRQLRLRVLIYSALVLKALFIRRYIFPILQQRKKMLMELALLRPLKDLLLHVRPKLFQRIHLMGLLQRTAIVTNETTNVKKNIVQVEEHAVPENAHEVEFDKADMPHVNHATNRSERKMLFLDF